MILPKRLHIGDTVGVIAPAGPPELENLCKAKIFFQQLGLKVQYGKYTKEVHGYLAGTDEQRLADFHDMIANPNIKAIFIARGGYGTGRIVPYIDYQLIKDNPKIIWGYSDITYLHTAIYQSTGLTTFHGPMPASDIGKSQFDDFSASLFCQLFQPTTLIYSDRVSMLNVIASGKTEAPLVGGNLSLIVSTIGTPFEIDVKDKILLIEDIGEEPYRIDSMLNQLKLSGKINDAAGIVIGDFANTETKLNTSLTLEEVFQDYFCDFNGPIMSGFKIGHCLPHFSIPLGVMAKLSTIEKKLIVVPGVEW